MVMIMLGTIILQTVLARSLLNLSLMPTSLATRIVLQIVLPNPYYIFSQT